MGRHLPPSRYAFQVIPGLESVVVEEWGRRGEATRDIRVFRGGHRNSTVLIPHCSDVRALFSMRTAEDVFAVVARVDEIPLGLAGLNAVERAVARPKRLAAGLGLVQGLRRRSFQRRIPYRLVTRDDGSADFTRHAAARHAQRAMSRLRAPRWAHVGEGAPVEIWLLLQGRALLCLLRLTDRSFRHRGYKTAHFPGSLRPTMAAAMVFLTAPKPEDRFVDPLCGAGTVAIERTLWGPARQVVGGDRISGALEACRDNASHLSLAPDWALWDAGQLPLPDYSVDKVATNLPFGAKHGVSEGIAQMYNRTASEVGRVLRPGGKAVFLTSRKRALVRVLGDRTRLHLERSIEVRILGKRAFVLVTMKK